MLKRVIDYIKENFPINGDPEDAKPELIEIIDQLVDFRPSIWGHRFGQTAHPETRIYKQFFGGKADILLELYKTDSQNDADEIEEFLIGYYKDYWKNFNISSKAIGRKSQKGPYIVYICLKKRFITKLIEKIRDFLEKN